MILSQAFCSNELIRGTASRRFHGTISCSGLSTLRIRLGGFFSFFTVSPATAGEVTGLCQIVHFFDHAVNFLQKLDLLT